MIRSMFASSANVAAAGNVAYPAASTLNAAPIKKMAARPAQDLSTASVQNGPVVPPAVLAMLQSPLMRSVDTARGSGAGVKNNASKLPFGATVIPAESKPAVTAPLAFGMRLTPVDAQDAPPPTASINPTASTNPTAATDPTAAAETAATPDTGAQPEPTPAIESPKQPAASTAADVDDAKARQDTRTEEDSVPAVTAAAASSASSGNDGSNDFARQSPGAPGNLAAAPAIGKTTGAATSPAAPSAMDALRASEPPAPASAAQPGAAVKEIAVRISAPQAPAVDVTLAQRGGQLHVAVRTADGGLQTSLRQDLGSLVNSLQRAGYRAEAFTPRDGSAAAALAAQTNSQNGGSQNGGQESDAGSGSRNGNPGDQAQSSGGGQQQQRQQQQQDQQSRNPRQPEWIEELENQA